MRDFILQQKKANKQKSESLMVLLPKADQDTSPDGARQPIETGSQKSGKHGIAFETVLSDERPIVDTPLVVADSHHKSHHKDAKQRAVAFEVLADEQKEKPPQAKAEEQEPPNKPGQVEGQPKETAPAKAKAVVLSFDFSSNGLQEQELPEPATQPSKTATINNVKKAVALDFDFSKPEPKASTSRG